MEIGPIFRALVHNRTRFVLIALEVALTMAIVLNCVTLILDLRRRLNEPNGMDEANLLAVSYDPFGERYNDPEFARSINEQDLRRLRNQPGVREAASFDFIPLAGSGSNYGTHPVGSPAHRVLAPNFRVGSRALQTLGVELVAGRDFLPAEVADSGRDPKADGVVIVTESLAAKFFPDGEALGKQIENSRQTRRDTIVGIIRRMHNAWPESDSRHDVMLFPGHRPERKYVCYLVRAEPGVIDTLINQTEDLLRGVDNQRVITVRTLSEYKARSLIGFRVLRVLLTAIIIMLATVTLLGIIGLTAFSVTERTRQIGTRRALGATKTDIVRHFLVENWIVTGVGLGAGILLARLLNYGLIQVIAMPKLSLGTLVLGTLALWLAGLLATLAPAWRATEVPPDLATRSV